MTARERQDLLAKIEWEGFDYTFADYSDWKEIKDKKFHELREAFVKAREALTKYIGLDD